jgi:hypothetical protein
MTGEVDNNIHSQTELAKRGNLIPRDEMQRILKQ